jgi:hypothetical protein
MIWSLIGIAWIAALIVADFVLRARARKRWDAN